MKLLRFNVEKNVYQFLDNNSKTLNGHVTIEHCYEAAVLLAIFVHLSKEEIRLYVKTLY